MRFIIILLLALLISCNSPVNKFPKNKNVLDMKTNSDAKVTGIGGIFFMVKNPETSREFYKKVLNLATNEYGSIFETLDNNKKIAYLQWSPFSNKTTYFLPSEKKFMINYRVNNLEKMVERFKVNGVTILDSIESYEYGKFLHILDPENNKIELWEPIDVVFTNLYSGKTTINTTVNGIYFKAKNPEKLNNWYKDNLGFVINDGVANFPYYENNDTNNIKYLRWQTMQDNSELFSSSKNDIINKLPRGRAIGVLNGVCSANIFVSDPKGRGIKPHLIKYEVDSIDNTIQMLNNEKNKIVSSNDLKSETPSFIFTDINDYDVLVTGKRK